MWELWPVEGDGGVSRTKKVCVGFFQQGSFRRRLCQGLVSTKTDPSRELHLKVSGLVLVVSLFGVVGR
jgi:hypothetical protein